MGILTVPWWVGVAGPPLVYGLVLFGLLRRRTVDRIVVGTALLVAVHAGIGVAASAAFAAFSPEPFERALVEALRTFLRAPLLQLTWLPAMILPVRWVLRPPRWARKKRALVRASRRSPQAAPPSPPRPSLAGEAAMTRPPTSQVAAAPASAGGMIEGRAAVLMIDEVMPSAFAPGAGTTVLSPARPAPVEESAPPPQAARNANGSGEPAVRIPFERVRSQLPAAAFSWSLDAVAGELRDPHHLLVPREIVLPQLGEGAVKVGWDVVTDQFPRAALALGDARIAEALPGGTLLLPLDEVIRQVPSEIFDLPANPTQVARDIDSFPEPFRRVSPDGYATSESAVKADDPAGIDLGNASADGDPAPRVDPAASMDAGPWLDVETLQPLSAAPAAVGTTLADRVAAAQPRAAQTAHPQSDTAHRPDVSECWASEPGHPQPDPVHQEAASEPGHPQPDPVHQAGTLEFRATEPGHPQPEPVHQAAVLESRASEPGHPQPDPLHQAGVLESRATESGHPQPDSVHQAAVLESRASEPGHPQPDRAHRPGVSEPRASEPSQPQTDPVHQASVLESRASEPAQPRSDPAPRPGVLEPRASEPAPPQSDFVHQANVLEPRASEPGLPQSDPAPRPGVSEPRASESDHPRCDPTSRSDTEDPTVVLEARRLAAAFHPMVSLELGASRVDGTVIITLSAGAWTPDQLTATARRLAPLFEEPVVLGTLEQVTLHGSDGGAVVMALAPADGGASILAAAVEPRGSLALLEILSRRLAGERPLVASRHAVTQRPRISSAVAPDEETAALERIAVGPAAMRRLRAVAAPLAPLGSLMPAVFSDAEGELKLYVFAPPDGDAAAVARLARSLQEAIGDKVPVACLVGRLATGCVLVRPLTAAAGEATLLAVWDEGRAPRGRVHQAVERAARGLEE